MNTNDTAIPSYSKLIEATYTALRKLGGSGKNKEIEEKAIELLALPDEILDIPHTNSSISEVNYRLAWARTLLKNSGAIENSARAVWSITSAYSSIENVDGDYIEKNYHYVSKLNKVVSTDDIKDIIEDAGNEVPDEVKPWRTKLYNILITINPYSFERLCQRLLRECGFDDVQVTPKSKDGGIDGTGKLKVNGMVSINIAFQCKRYQGAVGAPEIRDFRGSLKANIEKAIFITTGSFTKKAKDEAADHGKTQIDLIDGEEFMSKLAEYGIGLKEVKDYDIDENFFENI